MATNFPLFLAEFDDVVAGVTVPAASYQLFTYVSGTTTNKATYTDAAGASPNANPIILDSSGRCTMFGMTTGTYTLVLKTSVAAGGTTVWTRDDITPIAVASGSSYLPLAGGTMLAAITLSGNATSNLHAVPLQQVNTLITAATATFATSIANACPIGAVTMWLNATPPTNWLKLNGAAISRTTYATLFSLLGTTYGTGDGSTTFNLPEFRGEFPRFWDDARGIDSSRVLGSAQTAQNATHTHALSSIGLGNADGNDNGTDEGLLTKTVGAAGAFAGSTASSGATDGRPRNVALMAIIKAL